MIVVEPAAPDDSTLPAASSSKRPAPGSDGATEGPPSSRQRRTSSSFGSAAPFAAISRLAQWSGVLRVRAQGGHPGVARTRSGVANQANARAAASDGGGDGGDGDGDEMVLDGYGDGDRPGGPEAGAVTLSAAEVADLVAAIEANLDGPASKRDLLSLALRSPAPSLPSRSYLGTLSPLLWRSGAPGESIRKPPSLPNDCLLLIFEQLQHIRATTEDDNPWATHTGRYTGWRELRRMSFVCKAWRGAARPMYLSELHIEQTRELPVIAERLRTEPGRGEVLTRLFVKVYGFESGRSTDDAGFALPEILAHVPNLRVLELKSERLYTGRSSGRTPTDILSFTGVHLPTAIATALPLLHTLSYGLSCTLSDIQIFTTQFPELHSLEVTGDVPEGPPTTAFKACPPSLRRLWLPTASLTTQQLQRLLSSGSHVRSLGFTFDLDESVTGQPASEDRTAASLAKLVALFERVGPLLKELLVAAPYGDFPDLGPRLRLPGGWGGGAVGGAIQIAFQAHLGPGRPFAFATPPPAATPVGPVLAPIAPATGSRGRRIAPIPAPAAVPAAAPGGGGAPPGGAFPLFAFGVTNPTPFFEPLVAECPSLVHLELYGRRYPASIFEYLKAMPLEHLALSVPLDDERAGVVDALVEALEEENDEASVGMWKGLRRLELNGRGGEWEAAERRRIKVACQPRRITYASVEQRV